MIVLMTSPEITSAQVLERIKERAIAKWGEKRWKLELVQEYCRLEDNPKATPINRRPQIYRVFETGSCTLETALRLANAVGCRFYLECVERVEL